MIDQRERLSLVEPDHLESAVAAVEAVVLEADRRLGRRRDRAVDAAQLFEALAHSGRGYLLSSAVVTRVYCGSGSGGSSPCFRCTSAPPIRLGSDCPRPLLPGGGGRRGRRWRRRC